MTIRYYYRVDKYFEGRSRILVVLFFFFFFKQKTAYEMRISDWSSDVCSSDLQHNGGRWTLKNPWHPLFLNELTTIYPDAQLVMTHRDPVDVVGSACSLLRLVRPMFSDKVDMKDIAAKLQIGRASCRERVCQYV